MSAKKTKAGGCPICGKPNVDERGERLEHFPFCSARCKLVDLGKWLDGTYFAADAEKDEDGATAEGREDESD